ncbi:MAG: hypothetical protein GC191_17675 [Azospirillum sp.]|nr:hypothetical protein [Azospirillum sp.]
MADDKGLHDRHHRLARTVFENFYEALRTQSVKEGALTTAQIDRAFALIDAQWSSVLPAFAMTCKTCLAARQPVFTPDPRRIDYLTRLVFSRVVRAIPPRPVLGGGKPWPLVVAAGMKDNVQAMFAASEFALLNSQVRDLYADAGTDDDDRFWAAAAGDPLLMALVDKVFVAFLLRFSDFDAERWRFTQRLARSVEHSVFSLAEPEFCEIFEAMFAPYLALVGEAAGVLKLNLFFGHDTAAQVETIRQAFARLKRSHLGTTASRERLALG